MSKSRIPKPLFDEVSGGNLEINIRGSRVVVKTTEGNSVITRTNDPSFFGDDKGVKTIRHGECYEKHS